MGFLPLTSKSNAGTCPVGMSIPISFTKDTVGNKELMFAKLVVGELKVGEVMNLFAIFPIGATMQDGSKKKRSILHHVPLHCQRKIKRKEILN